MENEARVWDPEAWVQILAQQGTLIPSKGRVLLISLKPPTLFWGSKPHTVLSELSLHGVTKALRTQPDQH